LGLSRGEQAVEVAAPPETCFEAIVDYESFPDWQRAVERAEVLERYPDGLGKVVEFDVDAKFRRVTYRLRYHYDRPRRAWWDFVEGDGVEHVDGEYLFEPTEEGALAIYRLGIDAGIPIPGLIARRLNHQVMKRSVEDLKREAERRARTA
jgi:ribosome-associated toxin RatA of RatAB toxin-antitoxin module